MCEQCGAPLDPPLTPLFRLQNVATKRRDRINSDEEERVRQGFEVQTGVRFAEREGRGQRVADIVSDGTTWGTLTYGGAATLWRINLGWNRRKNQDLFGFVLDTQSGYWATEPQAAADDQDDPLSNCQRARRPLRRGPPQRAALRSPPEPLPRTDGIARRRPEERDPGHLSTSRTPSSPPSRFPTATSATCSSSTRRPRAAPASCASSRPTPPRSRASPAEALELCHFDPDTGADLGSAPGAREDCEAACYDCLLSYSNQSDHRLLDRFAARDTLLLLATPRLQVSPLLAVRAPSTATELDGRLRLRARDEVPRATCTTTAPNLPTHGQRAVNGAEGPPRLHLRPTTSRSSSSTGRTTTPPTEQRIDAEQTSRLEDAGYRVIRFQTTTRPGRPTVAQHPDVFGSGA